MRKQRMTTRLAALAMVTIATGAVADEGKNIYESWTCSKTIEVPNQPCGGENTRILKLRLYVENGVASGGLVHDQSYGGCYPVRHEEFGAWTGAVVEGDTVTADAKFLGTMNGSVPTFYGNVPQAPFKIKVDLRQNTVTVLVDHKMFGWEQMPTVLDCEYSRE